MRVALHPTRKTSIGIDEYLKQFGSPPIDLRASDNRPRAICPFCAERLMDRARASMRSAHFAHHPNSGPCPSKESAGKPYITLTPTAPDREAGRRLKKAFGSHWLAHYTEIQRLIPFFAWQEFVLLLDRANDKRIWEYKDLEEDLLPYALVLLADFPPWTSWPKDNPKRKLWFRFWYKADVRSLDQLWIELRQKTQLFRISFKPPASRRARPKFDTDLVGFAPMSVPSSFLAAAPDVRDFVVPKVTDWMRRHGGFGL